jgi:2'-hydroxyisoflavone reductase
MKALVIGGTLFIGRELVRRLLAGGHDVTVLHRKGNHDLGAEVENLNGDRNDGDSIRAALAGRRFDVVFDNVYDWRRGTTADQVLETARACGDHLQRYVYMSSVAAYGDGLDHADNDPLAPDDHPDSYVRNKATSERALFSSGLPVVTLRPPFIYGPGNPFYREAFFWDRFEAGRPVIIPGNGRRLMQFAYVKDLAQACIQAAEKPEAIGHGFNIANPEPITQENLVRAFAKASGHNPQLVHIPREKIESAGGSVLGPDNLYFAAYYDMPPITQKIDGARSALGFVPTEFDKGLLETYDWYKQHRRPDELDFGFEDRLLGEVS